MMHFSGVINSWEIYDDMSESILLLATSLAFS